MLGRHPARVLAQLVVLQARGHPGDCNHLPTERLLQDHHIQIEEDRICDVEMGSQSQHPASIDVQNTHHDYCDQRSLQAAVAVGVDPQ